MLKAIARLLSALNSETEPGQISFAFCLAMIAGLTPLLSLHNILVFLLALILRVNLSTFILGLGLFSGIAYLLDPLFHQIGLTVLTANALEGPFTALYNVTLFRLERFNNSIVMGSLLFSIILFVPLYLVSNQIISRYREHVLAKVRNSRIMQAFKATKFYRLYATYSEFGGAS